jgi:hypothetical protein
MPPGALGSTCLQTVGANGGVAPDGIARLDCGRPDRGDDVDCARREASTSQERTMTDEEMKAELERLKAENEALKARSSRAISLKVSEKGGLSVYGMGRFPITLYKEQWTKLLDMADEIRAFLKENDGKLKAKQ